jgi:glycolate oxidase FAD binding subunit
VDAATRELGGQAEPLSFWDGVRDHAHPALAGEAPLWRLSLPQTAPIPAVGDVLAWDWAGTQVWLRADAPAEAIWRAAAAAGGHATRFRGAPEDGGGAGEVFQPLAPAMLALHQRLKGALDPAGVLNPGRMYGAL